MNKKINPQKCKYFYRGRGMKGSHFEHFPPPYYECLKTRESCNLNKSYCKNWEKSGGK